MQELEREVRELQSEVAILKSTPATTSAAAPAMPQSNLVKVVPAAVPGAPMAPPPLASLPGPTSLSGSVDVYYGQNFDNPTSPTACACSTGRPTSLA
jgi:hypothetical protein